MTTETETRERHGINRHVASRATDLFEGSRRNSAAAVGGLAKLRRAASSDIGEDPAAWQVAFLGYGDRTPINLPFPTAEEEAIYLALTLFALHQQSKSEPMNVDGPSFGSALNRLAHVSGTGEASDPVIRRFNALVTADSAEETRWHLRSLIGQLRAHGIPLDYGDLADDLAALGGRTRKNETADQARRRVQLRWSRGFSRTPAAVLAPTTDSE